MRIEEVTIHGDTYFRAEEGTETKARVDILNFIGDSAHQDDELIPVSSALTRVIAAMINSNSMFGRLIKKFWIATGSDPVIKIRLYTTWKKERQSFELQRKEEEKANSLYIEQLRLSRMPK